MAPFDQLKKNNICREKFDGISVGEYVFCFKLG